MKVTHTDLFSIAPGKGLASPGQKIHVSVKLNRQVDFTAKLLISYSPLAPAAADEVLSIDQQWARSDRQSHLNIIIPITRSAPRAIEEEKPVFKKTDSPVHEVEVAV
jgi:hypothetical protein